MSSASSMWQDYPYFGPESTLVPKSALIAQREREKSEKKHSADIEEDVKNSITAIVNRPQS